MDDYEAEKSIKIAESALREGDYDKAKRFLIKSIKIQSTAKAQYLLTECEKLINAKNGSSSQTAPPRKQSNATNREETKRSSKSSEDAKLCDDIMRKTDYYEIIGIPKTATEEEIKKAYKKLALKLHPDKNHAPQSTEAFKKVTQAFACLTDKNKRKVYDEHGTEQNFRQQYHEYFRDEDQFDPEDIFEMFFGGGANSSRRRRYYQQHQPQQYHQHYQQQEEPENEGGGLMQGRYRSLLQFAPIIILLFAMVFLQMKGFGGTTNYSGVYSLERKQPYLVERETQNAQVEYYVAKDFYNTYKGNPVTLAEIEAQIEQDYLTLVFNQCKYVRDAKQNLAYQLRHYSLADRERERLGREMKGLDFSPCQEFERLRNMV